MEKSRSLLSRTLRGVAHTGGKALLETQRAWRRHVIAAEIRKELTLKHRQWCSGFEPPPESREAARRFLARNFNGYDDLQNHELYWRVTGRFDSAFIPAEIFYCKIEPALNAMPYVSVLTDKNNLYSLSMAPYLPEPVLHIVRGDLYLPGFVRIADTELARVFASQDEEFIVKPAVEHGAGRDMQVMDGPTASAFISTVLSDHLARRKADWVIQRFLTQCPEMARFNATSVNTFRILMMTTESGVIELSSFLRTGRSGMRVDNYTMGGIAAGIENGRLRGRGLVRDWYFLDVHPDSGVPFTGELPAYHEALELCRKLQRSLPWFDLVSWDVAVDAKHQPRIIEFNVASQGIETHQLNNGPLFGPEGGTTLSLLLKRLAVMPPDPQYATS
ncbi:MAG TPA: sugar-transfer associated ATP-grasp domain-containing protein [Stellaceae bacterium]|nr:sugar-transfer associated ATP-grasp domain-containing protein [Stellaceae bacterium]